MKWKVPYIGLSLQFKQFEREITAEFKRVMDEGSFILRDDVKKFEENLAAFLGVKHVIGVNSGTDALYLSIKAAGVKKDDEVITVAHTFVASIASIVHVGAKPVLVQALSGRWLATRSTPNTESRPRVTESRARRSSRSSAPTSRRSNRSFWASWLLAVRKTRMRIPEARSSGSSLCSQRSRSNATRDRVDRSGR